MSLCRIILLTAIAFVVYTDPLLAAENADDIQAALPKSSSLVTPASISGTKIFRKRSLQVGNTVKDGDVNDSTLENRASGVFSKVSSVFDMFRSKNSLVERWVKADKSDEFVLTKLKLTGLAGNALKTSKNYVYFEHFLKMRDTNRVNTWLAKNVPTYDVWKTLGFDHVRTFMDMKKIAHTDAYQLYLRYALAFDDHANTNFIQNKVAPTVISSDASWAEKISRTSAWITAGRSEAYVKTVLGLDKLPSNGKYVSTNYQFYMYFQLATLSIHRSLAEHTIFVYLRNAPIHVKLTPEALEIENNLLAYLHLDIVASLTKLSREN